MMRLLPLILLLSTLAATPADFPLVSDDLEVKLFAREPLVRNPCAIAFDAKGRLCVGMGPQYRTPKLETAGDSVWILLDENHDGVAEGRKRFATGFNSIQGLAWKNGRLWVANAPDLTVVRDIDGDEVADEYIRLYTDLGNLEHGLHGLNWAPDGRLYMSKGNSKGLTQLPDRVAPRAFRELWGVQAPDAPDFPAPKIFNAANYQKNYHDPADDWGREGGILRCDGNGKNLEIFSRGFRNPWDICFDDGFTWLGTDNDQTHGDKIFSPFYGAHFGWGHPWSYDWKGDNHLPTVPAAGPLFEGSGTGVIFCSMPLWPKKYRGVFLINDWLRRQVYIFRPKWDGARLKPEKEKFDLFAHAGGGRTMGKSEGRSFSPVDIEVGPDGAVWISSWGREYGAKMANGNQQNEGRIYRLWPKGVKAVFKPQSKRAKPLKEWSMRELLADLGSHLPVWRANASEQLVRRKEVVIGPLMDALRGDAKNETSLETWAAWTLGRIQPHNAQLHAMFGSMVQDAKSLNLRLQSLRILAWCARHPRGLPLPDTVRAALTDTEPRIRREALLAIREAGHDSWHADVLNLLARETDRMVFYTAWGALLETAPAEARKAMLTDQRAGVRRGAFLSLLEEDALAPEALRLLAKDTDPSTAALAKRRLGGKAAAIIKGPSLKVTPEGVAVSVHPLVSVVSKIEAHQSPGYREARLQVGAFAYVDRRYRILELPSEFAGETFIQGRNHDAEAGGDRVLTLTLRHPSTVFLADDVRGGGLPTWAHARFKPTQLQLHTDDARHRIYMADFPSGKFTLGGNSEGVKARKSNYLVIIRPKLLTPPIVPTTAAAVLSLLKNASADRGQSLFHARGGANCALCHQLENNGNIFAPDLADIGSRADANGLIRSILKPSAEITEGFALRVFTKKSGDVVAGIVLAETGQSVKLALANGTVARIAQRNIQSRQTLKTSAMPPTFGAILQPQQVADLIAYLQNQKNKPQTVTPKTTGFSFTEQKDRVTLRLDGRKITEYLLDHPHLTRRAFINVHTHTGIQVTRNYPPMASDGSDHPIMHPGIWMGFGHLDGQDYWRLKAKVLHDGFVDKPKDGKDRASFTVRNRYLTSDGNSEICHEINRIEFRRHEIGMLLLWDSTFQNDKRDFHFGDQEESGLAIRVATPLNVQGGTGTIINDSGEKNGAGTWGRPMRWIDYSGKINKRQVGLMIVPAADNPRQCWSHSRDYGVLVANPFPKQPKERREPYVKTWIKKGQPFRIRYAVLIHDTIKAIDHAKEFRDLQKILAEGW